MKYIASCLAAVAGLLAAAPAGAQRTPAPAAPAAVPGYPAALPVVPAGPVRPLPPSQWTAAQIGEAFDLADSDGNGELTRAEAQNLVVMPRSFEDMDVNKDGVVTRAEYEAAFPR